ncbi:hypothetical protein CQW23_09363 [Capsicum baccatum]|uniref:LRR receptor-like serine/threonine-protein kinase n=1 Tax=Capsicum baccatum TaxID=33114 RepID=A0A2G2WWH6_CAPBA|nr:hypothetical protein CQW23_09363 [Capsicum baccatum]
MALDGRIPREFGNLTFLVSLDLRRNNFHGNLPQEMARLRRLKFLDLSVNNFSGEVPSWFGFLHQLQVLNLRNNSFTGSIPCSFSNISTLDTLNLNFNSIEGQIPKVIGNLRELKLRGNNLIGSIPLSLSNTSRLETLDISYNSLQGNIPEEIGNLHNMNLLSIQTNQLTGSIPLSVFNISRIENIGFTGNSLSGSLPNGLCNGIIPQEIGNLVSLVELAMEYNQITGSVPISLLNISLLQILSLSMNNLKYGLEGLVSTKCDVYSYGVMFLETFTRRKPNEFEGDLSLKQWVSYSLPDAVMEVVDANLLTSTVPLEKLSSIYTLENNSAGKAGTVPFRLYDFDDSLKSSPGHSLSSSKFEILKSHLPVLVFSYFIVGIHLFFAKWYCESSFGSVAVRTDLRVEISLVFFEAHNISPAVQAFSPERSQEQCPIDQTVEMEQNPRSLKKIKLSNGLKKVLSGKSAKPATTTEEQWQETDEKALSTIQLCLSHEVLRKVINEKTAAVYGVNWSLCT